MNRGTNRQWRLAARPTGLIEESNFRWAEEAVRSPQADGEILVRNLYLSLDPTQRGWMARDTYLPAIPLGDVIRSVAVGRIEVSKHPGFSEGDIVSGMFGWQDYAL